MTDITYLPSVSKPSGLKQALDNKERYRYTLERLGLSMAEMSARVWQLARKQIRHSSLEDFITDLAYCNLLSLVEEFKW